MSRAVFISFVGGLCVGICVALFTTCRKEEPVVVTRTDTLRIVETRTEYLPTPSYSVNLPSLQFAIAPSDTIQIRDSIYIEIPMEQKVYEDSLYTAYVSGYRPQLDSIALRIPTTFINTTTIERKPAPRLSFGVQVGGGAVYGIGQKYPNLGIYCGVGLTYRLAPKGR